MGMARHRPPCLSSLASAQTPHYEDPACSKSDPGIDETATPRSVDLSHARPRALTAACSESAVMTGPTSRSCCSVRALYSTSLTSATRGERAKPKPKDRRLSVSELHSKDETC